MKSDVPCAYCGAPVATHRDHVVPRARGGPDTAANVVMACSACNGAKGDQLASEWLGDRCPHAVLLIEARVNAKLKSVFKRRDTKPVPLYGFNVGADGVAQFVGVVVGEDSDTIRLEMADALMLSAGVWTLTGELRDVPRGKCRLFTDLNACVDAVGRTLQRLARG